MKRIKDISFYSTLCFTLLMLTLCAMYGVAEGLLTTADNVFGGADFADKAVGLLLYSVGVGLSFLVFDIKPLNKVAKRVIHVGLNYVLMVIALYSFFKQNSAAEVASGDMTMLIFAGTFVFIAVYCVGMALCHLFGKLDKALASREK